MVLSYPHFGPKNTRSNFLSVSDYFKFTMSILQFSTVLQTHIVLSLSLNFLAYKTIQNVFLHSKSLKRVSKTIAYFLAFYSKFCIKSYKRVFWSFPIEEPILVPTICLWVFSTCLHKSLINFYLKIILILHLSQSESVWVVLVLRGILVLSHQMFLTERYFKIPHFGSLFVLVHFLSFFNCFTLRCFQNYIFYPFLHFAIRSKFLFNCRSVQMFFNHKSVQFSFFYFAN